MFVLPSSAGNSRTTTQPSPNGSRTRPRSASSASAGDDPGGGGFVQLDHFGDQQPWRLTPPSTSACFDALIDQTFVGGVLIDDHDAVAGLGHDIGVVHLRPRRAQRMFGGGSIRLPASAGAAGRAEGVAAKPVSGA